MAARILIVDDEADICSVLGWALKSWGYEVASANDGALALEMLKAAAPDAVLLDLRMPGLGGEEFLLRAREFRPGLPVILLTGVSDETAALNAMRLGASDYILKPVDFPYLKLSLQSKLTVSP